MSYRSYRSHFAALAATLTTGLAHAVQPGDSPSATQVCQERLSAAEITHAVALELSLLDLQTELMPSSQLGRLHLRVAPIAANGPQIGAGMLVTVEQHSSDEGRCGSDALTFELEIQGAGDSSTTRRVVTSGELTEEARARTLAMVLAELLRTTRNANRIALLRRERERLDQQKRQRTLREQPTALPAEATRAQSDVERLASGRATSRGPGRIAASAIGGLAFDGPGQLLGVELAGYVRHLKTWRWALEASWAHAAPSTDFGALEVTRWGVAFGGDWNSEDVPGLLIGPRGLLVALAAEGQSRLGIVEETQRGYGFAMGGRVAFEVPFARGFFVRSTLDAAASIRTMTFTAGAREAFAFRGLQATWGLGAGWSF